MLSTSVRDQRPPSVTRLPRRAITSFGIVAGLLVSSGIAGVSNAPVLEAAVPGGSVYELQVTGRADVPEDASAVVLNLTAVNPSANGHLIAYPCGQSRPTAATVNYQPGRTATGNSAIVDIGTDGKVCIYSKSRVDIVADVNGWFPAGSDYTGRNPQRLLDTRNTGTPGNRSTAQLKVTGRAGVPSNAKAVVLNLTAVNPSDNGHIIAYPCGQNRPTAATLNYQPGVLATGNNAIVEVGSNGNVCLYVRSRVDIVADISGWFPAGSDYTSRNPQRLLDTRDTGTPGDRATTQLQITGRAGVPSNAAAVVLNLTAVNPSANGHLIAYPCGQAKPTAATLNYQPGILATGNNAIVDIGSNGRVCIYNRSRVDIVADINGWFPAGSDYSSRNPQRLLDTRVVDLTGVQFVETFDGNGGLDRFDYGVYHRDVAHQSRNEPNPSGVNNNSRAEGSWTGDHDLNCGSPDTQRTLRTETTPDGGANGWRPYTDFHLDELVYVCRDHVMTSMGDIAPYSVLWFSPDVVFENDVTEVSFDVNLTDLGGRQWIKWGVVSDELYRSRYTAEGVPNVPGHVVSDLGVSGLNDLNGPDRVIATFSGQGTESGLYGVGIRGRQVSAVDFAPGLTDKRTRHPVKLVDNRNGTITASVAGYSGSVSGSFPECPCRVVLYDHNYNPDKDGRPIGHTWHWDNIIVR